MKNLNETSMESQNKETSMRVTSVINTLDSEIDFKNYDKVNIFKNREYIIWEIKSLEIAEIDELIEYYTNIQNSNTTMLSKINTIIETSYTLATYDSENEAESKIYTNISNLSLIKNLFWEEWETIKKLTELQTNITKLKVQSKTICDFLNIQKSNLITKSLEKHI